MLVYTTDRRPPLFLFLFPHENIGPDLGVRRFNGITKNVMFDKRDVRRAALGKWKSSLIEQNVVGWPTDEVKSQTQKYALKNEAHSIITDQIASWDIRLLVDK